MQVNVLHNLKAEQPENSGSVIFEDTVQKLTNDKTSKNTYVDKNKVIDTREKENQTLDEYQKNIMLIPLNTSLIINKPRFLRRFRNIKVIKLAIIYTISLIIMAFSFCQIYRLNKQKTNTLELTEKINSYITENTNSSEFENYSQENEGKNTISNKYTVDFENLKKLNSDTKGWIKVNGIGLDFPIVQTKDNKFYLKHSFDKSYNVCGWAFADYRNSLDGTDKNIIIFGHNRRDGTMFSQMINILEPSWYNNAENKYVTFITENEEATYEIFSIYQIKVEDYYIQTNFNSNEDYQKFLETLKSRSTKDYNINLTTEDKILTLSTCGKENKYRIVLHAKKL